jgi:predicted nucleic acid-binding Zn ribbon protein
MEIKPARTISALPAADSQRPSCVGRERELERLCQLWQEVQKGAGRVALVSARPAWASPGSSTS